MKISQIITNIKKEPDNAEYFRVLFEKTYGTRLHDWIYAKNYFLSLRTEAIECIELALGKEAPTWYNYSKGGNSFSTISGETSVHLSQIHFGIKGPKGWDLCTRINTPEFLKGSMKNPREVEDALVVCEQSATNYGHFQLVTMARIYDIYNKNGKRLPSNNIVIDDNLRSFTKELIEIHPLFKNRNYIGARQRTIRINRATYIPNAKRLGMKKEAELINKMWDDIEVRDYEYIRKRVYIERRTSANGSTQRKVVNTEERDKWLKKYGFTLLFMEDIAVNDKISLFRNAECVVGVEGAALVNICHMQQGTKVVELHHKERYDKTFEEIAKVRGLIYKRFECKGALGIEKEKELIKSGRFSYHMFPLLCDFEELSEIIELN
tara:strand:- start:3068 stop:4204 length:1137 start_codon:yes stop_codon:yes gene_type:complete